MTSKEIVIYGLGNDGKEIIEMLSSRNIHISKIIDNNQDLQEHNYHNINIVSEEYLSFNKNIIVIVGCSEFKSVKHNILKKGITEIYKKKDLYITKHEKYPVLNFQEEKQPIVSIVITAKNEWDYTYNCIESIYNRKTNIPYEIILGDNCSTDQTSEAENYFIGVNIIHHKTDLYYLGNCNESIKYAKGKYIYLLGNDTLVLKDYYLENFLKFFTDKKVAAISGKTVLPCNDTFTTATAQKYNSEGELFWVDDRTQEVDFLLVTNMMILRQVWESIGGYSPEFLPAYYEDNDLCMKLKYQGYKLLYLADSVDIIHYEGVTVGQEQNYPKRNKDLFNKKWKDYINSIKGQSTEEQGGITYYDGK